MTRMLFPVVILSLHIFLVVGYEYQTKWFTVPLDHFSFSRNETFKIKYLVNNSSWDATSGPIFFYTGNEGQIEVFAKNTGFMWDIAKEFRAMLVFAEHRYYGESMPFGNKSLDNAHIGYLTASQALADYADLVNFLQGNAVAPQYPVIAFGGSYGGMLAAYFRIKYPHLVDGAISASAPLRQFTDMTSCLGFARIVSSSFKKSSLQCEENIKRSWTVLRNFTKNANNTAWLQQEWKLCGPVTNSTDVDELADFIKTTYETIAMVNYPYACDFLVPLPANPVRFVCQFLSDANMSDKDLMIGIGAVLNVYTNYTGTTKCKDYKNSNNYGNLDASGWDYQACTEMVMPMCTSGIDDMFEPKSWDEKEYARDCIKQFGVGPSPDLAKVEFGGDRINAASNIVFSNGLLDPWAAGGIVASTNDDIVAIAIPEAAHHLDLMASNPSDTSFVREAREIHKRNIKRWINLFRSRYQRGRELNRT